MFKFDHELMVIPSFNTSVIFPGGKVFLESRFCFPNHNDEMSGPESREKCRHLHHVQTWCPLWQSIVFQLFPILGGQSCWPHPFLTDGCHSHIFLTFWRLNESIISERFCEIKNRRQHFVANFLGHNKEHQGPTPPHELKKDSR